MIKKIIYLIIVCIGLMQVVGYILSNKIIRGIGMACGSAPLPLVFTKVKGVETFASDFFMEYQDTNGVQQQVQITPSIYAKLKGPYNRRNVYGAAISYGPIMKKELCQAVLDYGICNKVLITEMGIPLTGSNYAIRVKTKTKGKTDV